MKENDKEKLVRLKQLLDKEFWTEEEKKWLLDYLKTSGDKKLRSILWCGFGSGTQQSRGKNIYYNPDEELQKIHEIAGIRFSSRKRGLLARFDRRLLVAASVIMLFLLAGYLLSRQGHLTGSRNSTQHNSNIVAEDVPPGAKKATLVLGDGSEIILNQVENGVIAGDEDASIIKTGDQLNYKSSDRGEKLVYNTVITPMGGQYALKLSDGTRVLLNAASSIRFPAAFPADKRVVEITGEVYFEVTPKMIQNSSDRVPFIVKINKPSGDGGEVKVLGTHFNVMAYPDEKQIQTTLLEGAVEYENRGEIRKLMPGQQVSYSAHEGIRIIEATNIDEAISWKDGFFHFEGSNLDEVLRRLSRWYNTEVVIKRKVNDRFYADIPMNTMLSDALKALELTGVVHFSIENGKIIVN